MADDYLVRTSVRPDFDHVWSVRRAKAAFEAGPGSPEALLAMVVDRGVSEESPQVKRHWEVERPAYDAAMEQLEVLERNDVEAFPVWQGQTLSAALHMAVAQVLERKRSGAIPRDGYEMHRCRDCDADVALYNATGAHIRFVSCANCSERGRLEFDIDGEL